MAGIYIHIPFCAKKCFYCDFYVSLSINHKEELIKSLHKELKLRKNYLENELIETIYFGGGTPSLLMPEEINSIIESINSYHKISDNAEITLEANPDDLTKNFLKELKQTEVNRLSIGIQSFFDDDLKLMNRRHNEKESRKAIANAQDTGFNNITGDLIYGLPTMTDMRWKENLKIFFKTEIPHLSAYHLTYEAGTVFSKYLRTGKIKQISEEESLIQYELLVEMAKEKEYIHYETSNFAKEGYFSRHNSAYWKQKKYLGIGPSAHSYNGNIRQNNIANMKKYIEYLRENKDYYETEKLTLSDKFNEYLITTLRTIWGTDISYIKENYGTYYQKYIEKESLEYLNLGILKKKNNILSISEKEKFIEDKIIEDLFYYEEKKL